MFLVGLSLQVRTTWKNLYLDDLRLKRNWRKGKCIVTKLTGHTNKWVPVCLYPETVMQEQDRLYSVLISSEAAIKFYMLISEYIVGRFVLPGHFKTLWTANVLRCLNVNLFTFALIYMLSLYSYQDYSGVPIIQGQIQRGCTLLKS